MAALAQVLAFVSAARAGWGLASEAESKLAWLRVGLRLGLGSGSALQVLARRTQPRRIQRQATSAPGRPFRRLRGSGTRPSWRTGLCGARGQTAAVARG